MTSKKTKNHLVFVVFDSARFDHVKAAQTPWLDRLGRIERRFSYASWTSPSHLVYLIGQLPHAAPKRTIASDVYVKEALKWSLRLNIADLSFSKFLPHLSLPRLLKKYGYGTHAMVSLPVLNESTCFSLDFDTYRLMPSHDDFGAMIKRLDFSGPKPRFYFLNVGETHYPYSIGGKSELPRLPGVHGVFKNLDNLKFELATGGLKRRSFFTARQLKQMKQRQLDCIEHLDGLLEKLYAKCPPNTHVIVTSDHGELFGEAGYFGHGPVLHEKVFEVPLVEGVVP